MQFDPTLILIVVLFGVAIFLVIRSRQKRLKNPELYAEKDRLRASKNSHTGTVTAGLIVTPLVYGGVGAAYGAGIGSTYAYPTSGFAWGGFIAGIVLGLIFAFIALAIAEHAEKKGRSFNAFFWLSVIVSPVIMGIIAATISPLGTSNADTRVHESKDIPAQIKKLGELRDSGLITKAEFEAKKKDLLERF